jgi:hypothetical protein
LDPAKNYDIASYVIASYDIASYVIASYDIASYVIASYDIASYVIASYDRFLAGRIGLKRKSGRTGKSPKCLYNARIHLISPEARERCYDFKKYFLRNIWRKKWRFFAQSTATFLQKMIKILVFEKNAKFFPPKIGKNRRN